MQPCALTCGVAALPRQRPSLRGGRSTKDGVELHLMVFVAKSPTAAVLTGPTRLLTAMVAGASVSAAACGDRRIFGEVAADWVRG